MRPSRGIGLAALFAIGWLQPGSGSALGADSSWTSPVSGLWFDPTRWTSGVPGAGDRAFFGATGGASEFTVTLGADWSIRSLRATNQRPILQTGQSTLSIAETLILGTGGENSSLVVDGGRLIVDGDVGVGNDSGTGTLTIANGAEAIIGRLGVGGGNPGSNGTLVVTGKGTTLSKIACCDPSIGIGAGNSGALTIEEGAAVSLSLGFVGIGREGGQGTVDVTSGGALSVSQGDLGIGPGISASVPGVGSLLVAGPGSLVSVANNNVVVGSNGGTGALSLSDGASMGIGSGELFVGFGSSPIGPGMGTMTMSAAEFSGRRLSFGVGAGIGDGVVADGSSVVLSELLQCNHGEVHVGSGSSVTCGQLLCGELSTLSLEVRMSGPPAITASGTATLNGALIVSVDPDAPPMPGESVVLIEAGSFAGAFDTITVPAGYAIAASSTSLSVLRVPRISGLSIAPQAIGLAVGFPGQASATVFFQDGGSLDVTALAQWSVSDPTKALVGSGGALLGLAKGSTTLIASFEGFEAAAELTVGLPGFANDTELITITADGQQAEVAPFAETPKVSADGRYVLFRSRSTVFGASPSITQAFLKDRVTGTLELVSVDSQGTPASSSVQEAAVSGDGRFVVFVAGGAGFVPVAAVDWEVWLRDRQTGVTELISVTTAGAPSMTNNLQCDVSDDGRFVVFNSYSSALVDPPVGVGQPLRYRIFVRDRVAGTTTLLSQIGGEDANASSIRPRISGDGRFVTFQTDATNLAPGDTNGFRDVFVCEIATGTIELVTVSTGGSIAVGGQCFNNEISFDGSLVTFSSDATNLVEGHNGVRHIYLRDRTAGTTTVMSTTESGELSSGPSGSNAISEDGTHVAFRTSGGLVKEDTNGANDVYRRRVADGALELVTRSAIDGSPLGNGVWTGLNGDGSLVAFQSDSPFVVPFDQNGVADIFARTMPVPALGDLDFDGDVDAADLAILLGAWGTAAADLTGDGVTDAADLAILLGAWTS